MKRRITGLLAKNLALKLISIGLAVLIFVLVHKEKHSLVQGSVPVSYVLPQRQVLVSEHPTVLTLGVTGPASRVRRFAFSELPPITIDLEEYKEGYFRLRDEMFDLPNGLKVAFVHPQGFQVRLEEVLSKTVPIQLALRGEVAQGYKIAGSQRMPSEVKVSGARRLVTAINEVLTEPLPVERARQTFVREVLLAPLPRGVTIDWTRPVTATVEVVPASRTITLGSVPVQVEGLSGGVGLFSPKTVKVLLDVPLAEAERIKSAGIVAKVTVKPEELPLLARPRVTGLPPGVSVVEITPAKVSIRERPRSSAQ